MSRHVPDEVTRALTAIENRGQVRTAQSAATADLGVARAYELASVVRTAMRETARMTEYERQLGRVLPACAGRLRAIGDVAALAFAEVIVDGTARAMVGRGGREYQ